MSVIQIERIRERRNAVRVEIDGSAYVTEKRTTSPVPGMDVTFSPLFGRILNLSESGVLLELDESLQPGRVLIVGMDVDGQNIELTGTVARVCRPRGSPRVHIGVRFTDVPEKAHDAIRQAVSSRAPSPLLN